MKYMANITTIEELYKIKQDNQDVNEFLQAAEQSNNLDFITERIRKIEDNPEIINLDAENYFMNIFCCEEKIGEDYSTIKQWYETSLKFVKYAAYKEYDISTLISDYDRLAEIIPEIKEKSFYYDLFFLEFKEKGITSRIEECYIKNIKNLNPDFSFYTFYNNLYAFKFETTVCNQTQMLIDMWNQMQDLYNMGNKLGESVNTIKFILNYEKDKLYFKDEETRQDYENAYENEDDFEIY